MSVECPDQLQRHPQLGRRAAPEQVGRRRGDHDRGRAGTPRSSARMSPRSSPNRCPSTSWTAWPSRFEQRPAPAQLQRQMRLAAAEIDAAVEAPVRVDQRHPHAGTSRRQRRALRRRCRHSQCASRARPSSKPMRARQPVAAVRRGRVGDVPELVARPRLGEPDLGRGAGQPLDLVAAARSRLSVLAGPPPRLKARPRSRSMLAPGRQPGVDRVLDEQRVAHLAAVAVDRDRLAVRAPGSGSARSSPGPRCRTGAARRGSSSGTRRWAGRRPGRSRARTGRPTPFEQP